MSDLGERKKNMFKRLTIITLILLSVIFPVMAFDDTSDSLNISENEMSQIKMSDFSDNTEVYNLISENIDKKVLSLTNLKNPEEFSSVYDCGQRARYNNVTEYVRFILENDFSYEQLEVFNRILESGTTIQSFKQVYEFWLTTEDDFSIIEEICELEDDYFSVAWYERAYNHLTDYEHGALSSQEIMDYQNRGITLDEILSANVLCRSKGQNIKNILSLVSGGTSIEQQAMQIYGVEEIPVSDSLLDGVTLLATERGKNTMLQARNKSVYSISKSIVDLPLYAEVIRKKVDDKIKSLGLEKPRISIFEDYRALRSTGYSVSIQVALLNKGYTPDEIAAASQMKTYLPYEAVKLAREVTKNEN